MNYVELAVTSNFSFLRGASHPEELIARAAELGYRGIGLTDHNTLAGVVRGYQAAKECKIAFFTGCRVQVALEPTPFFFSFLCYPQNRSAYANLCSLLTLGKRRAPKGECFLTLYDYCLLAKDCITIILPPDYPEQCLQPGYGKAYNAACAMLDDHFSEHASVYLALYSLYGRAEKEILSFALQCSDKFGFPLVATNDVHYHIPQRRPLQDVLSCIRNSCTIQQAGRDLFFHAERYLKPPQEMYRLFKDLPTAITHTLEIARRISGFSLAQLHYEYPDEVCPNTSSPRDYLKHLSYEGARKRYPNGIPEKVSTLLKQELQLIHELSYEKYFLTCYDIVQFARSKGILCQGRGAAANSAVCYCLEITSISPTKISALFARFVSKERDEPPDIDIDFEHERREEVIQYIYQKYGRHHAALTAVVTTYRHRSAIRDVGKALGLSHEVVDTLARSVHRWTNCEIDAAVIQSLGMTAQNHTLQNALQLASELYGFPRHLSQHPGGFVISSCAISEIVPVCNAAMEERTTIEWDKNDIEALGMLKIDILGLGMLSCLQKALEMINAHPAQMQKPDYELYSIPEDDPQVYQMLCQADTVGVFQVESRAQMSMLPRLKPRCFYDLVIEVAIVRPGPIQGDMVHPFLKRRNGLEIPHYPDERVQEVLGKTLGVPIFQEQAMQLAIVLAGFSPGEAEQLRRAMAAWKRNKQAIAAFQERIVHGMRARGYSRQFAESCVNQLKGFSEYGFPESHAASFALLVYASAWIKKHYPAIFAAALLNSQPMGFYAPAQIIRDAREHGVAVAPFDINHSHWNARVDYRDNSSPCTLYPGLRLIKGLREDQVSFIHQYIQRYGAIQSLAPFWSTVRLEGLALQKATLEKLARADAFGSLALSRRHALWQIKALPDIPLPLDKGFQVSCQMPAPIRPLSRQQEMFADYAHSGISLRAHPVEFIRELLTKRGIATAKSLQGNTGHSAAAAGIILFRQRPGTARGVVFLTLEDESATVNVIVSPELFERSRTLILTASCLIARGSLQTIGPVVYINARSLECIDDMLSEVRDVGIKARSYSY